MREPVWSRGRGALRRWLAKRLPDDDWSREFLAELDDELRRRSRRGTGAALTLWYALQVLSPATLRFVWAVRVRERGRRTAMGDITSGLLTDARHAWRGITRDRWAASLVVVTLAVGIGSVAAMYGLAERLFLAGPPQVVEPDRLLHVALRFDDGSGTRTSPWIPYNTAAAIRDGVDAFEDASIYRVFEDLARVGEHTRPVSASAVDGRYFSLLGPRPLAGRFLQEEDDRGVILSASAANASFGSPAAALGAPVRVGTLRGTVIGVAPPGFAGPNLDRIDVWIPLDREAVRTRNWWTLGRLAEGRTRSAAAQEAEAIHRGVDPGRSFQWAREGRAAMVPVHEDVTGERTAETSIAQLLLSVVGLVLLVSWINVLNLLLARITNRRSEVTVRLALGIGRWRLARLLLVESLLLSSLGGALSLPVAYAEGALVRNVLLPDVAWGGPILDLELLAVTFLVVLASSALLGLLPARRASRTDLRAGLSRGAAGPDGSSARLQTALATGQVTLSAALLLCAGLFVKSFWTMRLTDLGVDAADVLVVNLRSLDFGLGGGAEEEDDLYDQARRELERGGEREVALSVGLPFLTNFGMSIHVDGRDSVPRLPGGGPFISLVSGGYFETLGTDIVQGRGISEGDVADRATVAVVGASTADALWPGADPLGRCVRIGAPTDPCHRVIGVAEDVHRVGYREPPSLQLYAPLGSSDNISGSTLLVRAHDAGGAAESRLRAEIAGAVPGAPYVEIRRLDSFLDPEIRPWKLGAVMLSMVATLAIAMSLAGVVGVLTYLVTQRRREIGVRMALGASRDSIRTLVLRTGLTSALAGLVLGFASVMAASPWLGPLLFETRVADPLVAFALAAVLVGAAGLACALPAGRAARVDPVTTLRSA